MLPDELVAIMVCPQSRQPVVYFPRGEADRDEAEAFLFCPASRLRYPIQDGVPALLVEEATEVSPDAASALLDRARELGLRLPAPDTASRRSPG
jgi:uncharacterized protein YbaR (Trm112 family)